MVIHAPKEESVNDLKELGMMMMEPGFLCMNETIIIFFNLINNSLRWAGPRDKYGDDIQSRS